jgi:hypothetical protein
MHSTVDDDNTDPPAHWPTGREAQSRQQAAALTSHQRRRARELALRYGGDTVMRGG